jgi:16S rRNA (uracil1498-N3)-methyltransferase
MKPFKMHIFYSPEISGSIYTLDENESAHCIRVLRMKAGTQVQLIDGNGGLYEGVILNADPKKCTISVTGFIKDFEKRDYRLHIAISPLKNPDRLEWFIEKSVEIGIDEITPLICENTEKPTIKKERLSNLIIAAMKQSLKSVLTVLNDPCTLEEFLEKDHKGIRMIAHCDQSFSRKPVGEVYSMGNDSVILIGPEGDFSPEEIRLAIDNGYNPVHLGKSRLRTETAGIVACHSIYFMNQYN